MAVTEVNRILVISQPESTRTAVAAMATAVDNPTAIPISGPASASNSTTFEPFTLPSSNQRVLTAPHEPGTIIPLALRPSSETTLETAITTIKDLQATNTLTTLLAKHGALLFRGLPIHSADDFSRFAHAFGYAPHEIIGIVVERGLLAPNVAPANESPSTVTIYNHNESPQVPHAPGYIFFYAKRAPSGGGETPISSSLELFHRVQAEIPNLLHGLETKGILSTVRYRPEAQYTGGSTLADAFGKEWAPGDSEETKRAKVEAQIARYGRGEHTTWKWEDDGTLQVQHHIPALRRQVGTNLPVLFTGLASSYVRSLAGETTSKITTATYGDGSSIPVDELAKLKEITEEIRVLHKWVEGDVLVFDNVIAQHGREPWEGEQGDRVVLASLFDGALPGPYGDKDWEKLVQISA